MLCAEVPGHSQKTLTQTLIVHLLITHIFHQSLIVRSQQNRIGLVTTPDKGIDGRKQGLRRFDDRPFRFLNRPLDVVGPPRAENAK